MRRRIDREGVHQRGLLRRRQHVAVRQRGSDLRVGDRARLDVRQVDIGKGDGAAGVLAAGLTAAANSPAVLADRRQSAPQT